MVICAIICGIVITMEISYMVYGEIKQQIKEKNEKI